MNVRDEADAFPWYRYFWPWFVIALVGSAVLASLLTLWLAIGHRDSLVSDDWYRDGTAINRRLEREARARQLDVRASLQIDAVHGAVGLDLSMHTARAENGPLRLVLSHATRAAWDRSVLLERASPGHFVGRVEGDLAGRWYASLRPADAATGSARDWRIDATLVLPSSAPMLLGEES